MVNTIGNFQFSIKIRRSNLGHFGTSSHFDFTVLIHPFEKVDHACRTKKQKKGSELRRVRYITRNVFFLIAEEKNCAKFSVDRA